MPKIIYDTFQGNKSQGFKELKELHFSETAKADFKIGSLPRQDNRILTSMTTENSIIIIS